MSQELLTLIRAAETANDVVRDAIYAANAANWRLVEACPVKPGDTIDGSNFPPDQNGRRLEFSYLVDRVGARCHDGVAWFEFDLTPAPGTRHRSFLCVARLASSFIKD